jgi:hypothetical protein
MVRHAMIDVRRHAAAACRRDAQRHCVATDRRAGRLHASPAGCCRLSHALVDRTRANLRQTDWCTQKCRLGALACARSSTMRVLVLAALLLVGVAGARAVRAGCCALLERVLNEHLLELHPSPPVGGRSSPPADRRGADRRVGHAAERVRCHQPCAARCCSCGAGRCGACKLG